MVTNNIETILLVTGVLTAGMLVQFAFPLMFTKIVYGEAPRGGVGILFSRLWGLTLFCIGTLLIYSAYNAALRVPVMTLACAEKAGYIVCVFGTSLRQKPLAAILAAVDSVIVFLYSSYLFWFFSALVCAN